MAMDKVSLRHLRVFVSFVCYSVCVIIVFYRTLSVIFCYCPAYIPILVAIVSFLIEPSHRSA